MKKKVNYTAFATNRNGERERVERSATFNDAHISPSRARDVAASDLQRHGYTKAHIDDTRVTDN